MPPKKCGVPTVNKSIISKLKKQNNKYIGLWVAIDDKDRILCYGKDRKEVFNEAYSRNFLDKNAGIRMYKIHDQYIKNLIMGLLNYNC